MLGNYGPHGLCRKSSHGDAETRGCGTASATLHMQSSCKLRLASEPGVSHAGHGLPILPQVVTAYCSWVPGYDSGDLRRNKWTAVSTPPPDWAGRDPNAAVLPAGSGDISKAHFFTMFFMCDCGQEEKESILLLSMFLCMPIPFQSNSTVRINYLNAKKV